MSNQPYGNYPNPGFSQGYGQPQVQQQQFQQYAAAPFSNGYQPTATSVANPFPVTSSGTATPVGFPQQPKPPALNGMPQQAPVPGQFPQSSGFPQQSVATPRPMQAIPASLPAPGAPPPVSLPSSSFAPPAPSAFKPPGAAPPPPSAYNPSPSFPPASTYGAPPARTTFAPPAPSPQPTVPGNYAAPQGSFPRPSEQPQPAPFPNASPAVVPGVSAAPPSAFPLNANPAVLPPTSVAPQSAFYPNASPAPPLPAQQHPGYLSNTNPPAAPTISAAPPAFPVANSANVPPTSMRPAGQAPQYMGSAPAPPGPLGAPVGYPQGPQHGYGVQATQPYGAQQMGKQFGQMNMGAPGPQHSDLIDLMAERNVQKFGCDDIEVELKKHCPNPNARADPNIFRCTLNAIPESEELLKKSRLPFAITLHPFRDMKNLNIIQTSNIVRCRYCRSYINPYVTLTNNRNWRCNMCNRNNDLPDDFSWDSVSKSFGDPTNRPELRLSTVEFIAPSEYMLRHPQPAVYVFILDISTLAIQSGYLHTFVEQFLINLNQLPGDDRAMMAFIGVDSCLHFFTFDSEKNLPCELIVNDIDEPFLPTNTGLLVNMRKKKDLVRSFIQNLPSYFKVGPTSSGNCLGASLQMAYELIKVIGGRISVFQCSLPNIGPGSLQPRDDAKNADNLQNFGPATDFYKSLSLQCTGDHVSLDLFTFSTQFVDVASISEIAKFSTGSVYHFPNFNIYQDNYQAQRFAKILTRYLTRKIGFEAVLRIRLSRGASISGFYGNFFTRAPDLLAFANCNPDSAIAAQISIEEKMGAEMCFQSALLYTSSKGDRRIRVHTMCLPTTGDLMKLYNNFDVKATVSYLAKIGVERSMMGAALSDSREAIVNAVADGIGAYQKAVSRSGGMLVPARGHLRLFPAYALALLKHPAFSSARSLKVDDRVAAMLSLRFLPLDYILSDIYPKLYCLNELQNPTYDDKGEEIVPTLPTLPLSFEHINRNGLYLMEAGSQLFIYVGAHLDPTFIQNVFGTTYDAIEDSFPELDNDVSRRVQAFYKSIVALKFFLGPPIIVKEHSPMREAFIRRLVDDRSESTHSYVEFLQHLKREISG